MQVLLDNAGDFSDQLITLRPGDISEVSDLVQCLRFRFPATIYTEILELSSFSTLSLQALQPVFEGFPNDVMRFEHEDFLRGRPVATSVSPSG